MIQPQTRLKVADNTGAKEIMSLPRHGRFFFRQTGSVGELREHDFMKIIMASVKRICATPGGGRQRL